MSVTTAGGAASPRLVAFLRAINVGGHIVKMEKLRGLFETVGVTGVETFIASGNVIFTSSSRNHAVLERKIERQLETALGYEVKTFLRTGAEVAAIARYKPFTEPELQAAGAFCVGFLAEPLGAPARKALQALRTDVDDFRAHGREVYWLCRTRQGESKFSNAVFERTLKARVTFRGMNTLARLTEKHAFSPDSA